MNLRNITNLRINATNVRINEPYFIFGLTNLQVYEMCVFGITSRTLILTLTLLLLLTLTIT